MIAVMIAVVVGGGGRGARGGRRARGNGRRAKLCCRQCSVCCVVAAVRFTAPHAHFILRTSTLSSAAVSAVYAPAASISRIT